MRLCSLSLLLLAACQAGGKSDAGIPVRHPETNGTTEIIRHSTDIAIQQWRRNIDLANTRSELAAAYARLGEHYFAYEYFDAASDSFDAATRLLPDRAEWHYLKASSLYKVARITEALDACNHALELKPLPGAHRLRAELLILTNNFSEAQSDVNWLLREQADASANVLAARIAQQQLKFEAAQRFYEKALELQPDADYLHRAVANTLSEQGLDKQARAAWARAGTGEVHVDDQIIAQVSEQARDVWYYLDRGHALLEQRRYSRAVSEFEAAIALVPSDPDARLYYGRALEILGKPEAAQEQLAQAISLRPGFAVAHYFLGAFFERQGKDIAAIEQFRTAVESDSRFIPPRTMLGHALFRQREFEEALLHYQHINSLRPDDASIRFQAGLAHLALGQCEEATGELEQALKKRRNNSSYLEVLARAYAVCPVDPVRKDRALAIAQDLTQTRPDADALHTLALVYAAQEKFAEAIRIQQQAVQSADQVSRPSMERSLKQFQSLEKPVQAWSFSTQKFDPPRLTTSSR